MRLRLIIIVLLVGLTPVAAEATEVNQLLLRRLPAEKGWPEGEVNSIVRDEEGYVWIATAEGLTCFDGERCHTYHIAGRRSPGQDNSIHRLMLDSEGRLWMKAGKEYLYLDRRRKAFARNMERLWHRYGWTHGPDIMTTDAHGHLWAARDDEGLYALTTCSHVNPEQQSGNQQRGTWSYPQELKGLEATDLVAQEGRVWVAFNDGTTACCHLQGEPAWRVYRQISLQLGEGVKEELKLMADLQGHLWAYCLYGVWRYDDGRQEMSCAVHTEEGDFVRVIAQDAMQRIWVGRDRSGLSVLTRDYAEEHRLVHDAADCRTLPANSITALACGADSAVIIGTYQGGMALYHPRLYLMQQVAEGEVSALTECPQGRIMVGNGRGEVSAVELDGDKASGRKGEVEAPGSIVSMLCGGDGTLWAGCFRGGLTAFSGGLCHSYRAASSGLSNDNVWALAEDSCGSVWIATLGGGLQRLQPGTGEWTTWNRRQGGLADDYLSSLCSSRRGGLWIGLASKGFAYISYDDLRITNYGGTLRGDRRLHCPYINQLCEDGQGWLWLATRNGVEIYLPEEDELLVLPLPEGCSTSTAAAVAEDGEGRLWIALGRELLRVKVDRRRRRFDTRLYGREEGLTAGVLNQRALYALSDGRMAAGGTEGLCIFHPESMDNCYTLQVKPVEGLATGTVVAAVTLLLAMLAAGMTWLMARRRRQQPQANKMEQVPLPAVRPRRIVPQVSEQVVESVDEQLVARATGYVEANMQRSELTVEELSQELAMSRGHLYKRLTQLTGLTPVEFIRTIRLQRAAQLLERSGMSVAEVAYAVGFNNPKYFSRYFKEAYGLLPSAYRNTAYRNSPDEGQTTENSTSDNLSGNN